MRQLNIKIDIDLNNELTEWCNIAKQVKSNVIAIAIRQFLVSSTANTLTHMVNPPKPQYVPSPIASTMLNNNDQGTSDGFINF